jgi:hypothetical protein
MNWLPWSWRSTQRLERLEPGRPTCGADANAFGRQ